MTHNVNVLCVVHPPQLTACVRARRQVANGFDYATKRPLPGWGATAIFGPGVGEDEEEGGPLNVGWVCRDVHSCIRVILGLYHLVPTCEMPVHHSV